MAAERLEDEEQKNLLVAVRKLVMKDNALRPATFRDRSLMLYELATVDRKLIKMQNAIKSNKDIEKILDEMMTVRWAKWELRRGYKAGKVDIDNGMYVHPVSVC